MQPDDSSITAVSTAVSATTLRVVVVLCIGVPFSRVRCVATVDAIAVTGAAELFWKPGVISKQPDRRRYWLRSSARRLGALPRRARPLPGGAASPLTEVVAEPGAPCTARPAKRPASSPPPSDPPGSTPARRAGGVHTRLDLFGRQRPLGLRQCPIPAEPQNLGAPCPALGTRSDSQGLAHRRLRRRAGL